MKYRKKPVVVDVNPVKELLTNAAGDWYKLPKYIIDEYDKGNVLFCDLSIKIYTLEGWMRAGFGDLIIQGVNGELYPCKPDIFEKTYEKVEE